MKKFAFIILIFGSIAITTGCSSNKELENQVVTLQKENDNLSKQNAELEADNKKLVQELKTYKDKEEEEQKIAAEKSKYKSIGFDEPTVVDEYGEFTVKSAELTQKIVPPNPDSFYSYYEVKDPKEIYLDVIMDFKNNTTIGINTDEITDVKVVYGNGYEYNSFSTLEEAGGGDFTYTNINKVEPLKSVRLHHIATLPIEAKTSQEPIKIQFTIYGSNYEVAVR